MIKEKKCFKCKVTKKVKLFCTRKDNPDGYNGRCKACVSAHNKKYQTDNKTAINHQRNQRRILIREMRIKKAAIIKPVKMIVDIERVKELQEIMAVNIDPRKTHYYYMTQQHKETQKRINIR